jgi:hypothetical protein
MLLTLRAWNAVRERVSAQWRVQARALQTLKRCKRASCYVIQSWLWPVHRGERARLRYGMPRLRSCRWWVALTLTGLVVTGCSSSGGNKSAAKHTTTSAPRAVAYNVPLPEISLPPAKGNGINQAQPRPPLPPGYTESEFFVGGTATSFDAVTTPQDGDWTVNAGKTAKYRTRVIVRRPPASKFSGTVLVEWFNVTAIESDPDWTYLSQEIGREGDAYIGVSVQAQGVEGGKTLLNVNVNKKQAATFGVNANKSGLKHIDPARYGTLVHPGDAYAYDMFSQVGLAAKQEPAKLLGGLQPKHVIAVGESQSAAFLTTYVDAIQPLDPVFNGFLIHSRGSGGVGLNGKLNVKSGKLGAQAVLIRTDIGVPVFMFETETDLTLLGYSEAQQPDGQYVHTWENAGLSHTDAQLIRAIIGGPRDPNVGSLLGCHGPINTAPQHEVLQAALHALGGWVAGGAPPPSAARLRLGTVNGQVAIARDINGNALGGVRNPLVDAPIAAYSGEPPHGMTAADLAKAGGTICLLFGKTQMFDRSQLVKLYGTADNYVAKFRAAANKDVAAGFLLQPDADALIAEAEANRALFN